MCIELKNILYLMKNNAVNQNQLANLGIINHTAITDWKKGKAKPSLKSLKALAEYFNVPVSYFYIDHDIEQNTPIENKTQLTNNDTSDLINIPIIATVPAGFDKSIQELDFEEYITVSRNLIKGYSKNELCAFRVKGNSMFPNFLPNDIVIIHIQPSVDSGDIAVLSYADFEEATLKKIEYEPNCDYINLIPLNKGYSTLQLKGEELATCRIVGKVISFYRDL